jgi:hypothetical protein
LKFAFWQLWLQCVAIASALLGLLFLVAPNARVLDAYNLEVLRAFHVDAIPVEAAALHGWSLRVLGSTILGWGLLLAFVAGVPFRRREPWAWYAIAISVVVWVVADTVVSFRAGVYLEVLFNGVALALYGLPLRMTYREMTRPRRGTAAAGSPTITGDRHVEL